MDIRNPAFFQAPDFWKSDWDEVNAYLDTVKTCGDSRHLIPHLVDIGVDILNPIQPTAIYPAETRALAGDRLILWGGVCVQHTMPHGTPEDVHNEIGLRMQTIGKEERYILTPAHMLNDDVPWENIVAFFEAADKYGKYLH